MAPEEYGPSRTVVVGLLRWQCHCQGVDYSLNPWGALTANLRVGRVTLDNNHLENLMRLPCHGRKAWLFCGRELVGKRAAVVMSLV